jgi:preprotein translocase subunit YajC
VQRIAKKRGPEASSLLLFGMLFGRESSDPLQQSLMTFLTLPSSAPILQETAGEIGTADQAPGTDSGEGQETPMSPCGSGGMMMPMLAILAIFWIVMIGPERKKRKAREAMLGALEKGDKVMTNGGMYGSVAAVQDDVITVQVADNVRIKFTRAAIQGVIDDSDGKQSVKGTPPKG